MILNALLILVLAYGVRVKGRPLIFALIYFLVHLFVGTLLVGNALLDECLLSGMYTLIPLVLFFALHTEMVRKRSGLWWGLLVFGILVSEFMILIVAIMAGAFDPVPPPA